MSFYTVGNKDLKIILLKFLFWMKQIFCAKGRLMKGGLFFSRNEDFHTKGTFHHITTGA